MEYAKHLSRQGYAFIPGQHYQSIENMQFKNKELFTSELNILKRSYQDLTLDPYSPGNRWRGYAQCQRNEKGELLFGKFSPYKQTKAYNPDTGDIVRDYPLLPEHITGNRLLQTLLMDDFRLVEAYEHIGPLENLTIGIHLFRYQADVDTPAYSSPVWLHKDDEDIVFVHLINVSSNMLGGDSLIASHPRGIERVLRLEQLFDTLVVNHDKLHAVTPVGARADSGVAQRDIILITFQRNQKDITCAA
ncbi:3(1)-hydroxy-L-isoleucine 4-dioxygenase HilB [Pectobacterium punjabense]|nr:3(1)-hydroxy-L-isoleucine 4-dioxygenase HilB [Pectobacterium punjabense]